MSRAEPSGRAEHPWVTVSRHQNRLLSGPQLISAAWGLERSSVPLDTGQGATAARHGRSLGRRGRAWDLQLLGTATSAQVAGSSRP